LSIDYLLGKLGNIASKKKNSDYSVLRHPFKLSRQHETLNFVHHVHALGSSGIHIHDPLPFIPFSFDSTAAIFCLRHPLAPISILVLQILSL
jgi:hypothetical protein